MELLDPYPSPPPTPEGPRRRMFVGDTGEGYSRSPGFGVPIQWTLIFWVQGSGPLLPHQANLILADSLSAWPGRNRTPSSLSWVTGSCCISPGPGRHPSVAFAAFSLSPITFHPLPCTIDLSLNPNPTAGLLCGFRQAA